ncbi:fimbrial protein [Pseudomonas paralactis]|uniref:fimbrial protein n=1 Tax=Pseudomonas paralactis TaxID=1615673 RepID=UPI0034D49A48
MYDKFDLYFLLVDVESGVRKLWFVFFCFFVRVCNAEIVCAPVSSPLKIILPSDINWQKESHADGMISTEWHTASNQRICNGSGIFQLNNTFLAPRVGTFSFGKSNYSLFSTPVPGVGFIAELRYMVGEWGAATDVTASGGVMLTHSSSGSPVSFINQPIRIGARIRLVAIDKGLKSGIYTVPPFNVIASTFDQNGFASIDMGIATTSGITVTAKSKSCTLESPDVVKLPKSSFSQFKSVGDTAGDTQFSLSLVCSDSFAPYTVSYYMTDAYNSANNSALLASPDGARYVKGIRVQVIDGFTPVNFSSELTTLSRRYIGAVGTAGANLSKQFFARYKRDASKMSPGLVEAGVIVTLVYE